MTLSVIQEKFSRVWELRDTRLDGWPLLGSPKWTILICLSYLILVKAGQRWMKDRTAFEFKRTMIVYNFAQVVFNCWLFYEIGHGGWFHGYNFVCQPVDYSNDPMALRMLRVSYWYFISKFIDFFDTFFFVLRKKDSHVSVLHLVHHGMVPMSVWPGLRFIPGGHSTFFAFLNTLVHIVMYFYYMVAAMGPRYQKYLWWKKYLTKFQIAQFILATVHVSQLIFVDCDYPKAFVYWIAGHELLFLVLFIHFYKQAYRQKSSSLKSSSLSQESTKKIS